MARAAAGTALVTGAAKGIGLAIAEGLARRGFSVWLTARDASRAGAEAGRLRRDGLDVSPLALDVTSDESVTAAAAAVGARTGDLDVLVNNAAVLLDEGYGAADLEPATLVATLEPNLVGPLRVTRAFLPLLRRSRRGRVVNVSSTAGSIADMAAPTAFDDFDAAAYSVSKAALNAWTVLLARALRGDGILVNAMCPGWVRSDMGGPRAPLSPEEGADTALWLATLPDGGPSGGFFYERKPHPF